MLLSNTGRVLNLLLRKTGVCGWVMLGTGSSKGPANAIEVVRKGECEGKCMQRGMESGGARRALNAGAAPLQAPELTRKHRGREERGPGKGIINPVQPTFLSGTS